MTASAKVRAEVISPEEVERRKRSLRRAERSNAMEGLSPNPSYQWIFDDYVAGKIELEDVKLLMDKVDSGE